MSSGSFKQADVKCPFYKYDDGRRRITCEGLIDKSSIAMIYLTRNDFDAQLISFCCEHYVNCEIYRMLMQKYDEELEESTDQMWKRIEIAAANYAKSPSVENADKLYEAIYRVKRKGS